MRKTLSILLLSLIGCDPKEPEPRIIEIPDVHVESKIDKEPKEVKETLLDRSVLIKKYGEVLDAFVEEQLMFDEPIRNTEVGQEDGVLRGKWASAWRRGAWRYSYRGIWYYTRTQDFKPAPPQVCADFVIDTLDRTGGNWWYKDGTKHVWKGYRTDNNSFSDFVKSHDCGVGKDDEPVACYHRRVTDLISVLLQHPKYFEVLYDKKELGARVGSNIQRYSTFKELDVQMGDIVFIYGELPGRGNHWHSFVIYGFDEERDDWELVGNSAIIAKRWLTTEGRRTPRRKVWYVFRPTDELLHRIQENQPLGE